MDKGFIGLLLLAGACGTSARGRGTTNDLAGLGIGMDSGGDTTDFSTSSTDTDGATATSYTVYAHSDTVLYQIDLAAKTLVEVGAFSAPGSDTITDLAVAPDNTIYVISETELYTASPTDGHVTAVGAVTACGSDNVALTTTPDGNLYAGDHKGAFCKIDLSSSPPTVTQIGTLGGGLALSGDLVAVGDGTMYGSADMVKGNTTDDLLVVIDPTTGNVTKTIGKTGFPQLYGIAYAEGQVFGFTHDGSGDVVTIDPKTGIGTLFNTFNGTDGKGISFAGAGVNSMVAPIIN